MDVKLEKWHRCQVDIEVLKELSKKSDIKGLQHVSVFFGLLLVTGILAYITWGTWWSAFWFLVYGNIYGFSNYSRNNYRKNILKYIDVLDLSGKGPSGTHLGGTGIAVSNVSKNKDLAIEYAFWIAGAECQKSLFYQSGGQPGNSEAWEDEKINLETNDFFKATRKTLDLAWVRPRHNGYMEFQDKSGDLINEYLQTEISAESICEKLSDMYNKSFKE